MEASLASLQQYFEYNNETEDSGQLELDDTNVIELKLIVVAPDSEVNEAHDGRFIHNLEHSETETYLYTTEELNRLLQKTKDTSWQNSFQTSAVRLTD